MKKTRMRKAVVTLVAMGTVTAASPAWAHPHGASLAHGGTGQELANGQNHGPFTCTGGSTGTCPTGEYAETQTDQGDPAAYGIETAHHGPDSGDPGKADGKYQTDATATSGSFGPGSDDNNPAID
jgi:hypothetical protein